VLGGSKLLEKQFEQERLPLKNVFYHLLRPDLAEVLLYVLADAVLNFVNRNLISALLAEAFSWDDKVYQKVILTHDSDIVSKTPGVGAG
jgi:hypothetical protein